MSAKLVIAPEAESDLAEAYDWYERQRSGLGEQFLACVDERIDAICRSPESFETIRNDYHRALVRRFPFVAFYDYHDNVVTVYCVFHTARDPAKWRRRLP